jgi:chaperonin cofactor prefoldin
LHRLTTQTPAFLDETVKRHIEDLENELAVLQSEADKLAKEIEELTGESVLGNERGAVQ